MTIETDRDAAYNRLTDYLLSVADGTNPAGDGVVHRSEILDAVLGPEVDSDPVSVPTVPDCRHPEIVVQLTGGDGNAGAILGSVRLALRRAGVSKTEMDEFVADALSGDYDHLLQTAMKWVTVQ